MGENKKVDVDLSNQFVVSETVNKNTNSDSVQKNIQLPKVGFKDTTQSMSSENHSVKTIKDKLCKRSAGKSLHISSSPENEKYVIDWTVK